MAAGLLEYCNERITGKTPLIDQLNAENSDFAARQL